MHTRARTQVQRRSGKGFSTRRGDTEAMYVVIAALLLAATPVPDGAVLHGHERRGGLIERMDGAAGESWRACAAACGYRDACQAWTFRALSRACDLHRAPATPRRHPGAVTGLSPALAAAIEAAAERPPSTRERTALDALDHGAAGPAVSRARSVTRSQGLAGPPSGP